MSAAGITLLALLAVAGWAAPRPGPPHRPAARRRRVTPAAECDPAVLLDLLDVALAAGTSVPGALEALGSAVSPDPAAGPLRAAGASLRLGGGWREAWEPCPPQLVPLAEALEPAWSDGVDPCPLVRQAAATIRARRRRASQEAAERLASRLVLPLGLCFLPAFVLLAMAPVLLSGVGALLGP